MSIKDRILSGGVKRSAKVDSNAGLVTPSKTTGAIELSSNVKKPASKMAMLTPQKRASSFPFEDRKQSDLATPCNWKHLRSFSTGTMDFSAALRAGFAASAKKMGDFSEPVVKKTRIELKRKTSDHAEEAAVLRRDTSTSGYASAAFLILFLGVFFFGMMIAVTIALEYSVKLILRILLAIILRIAIWVLKEIKEICFGKTGLMALFT